MERRGTATVPFRPTRRLCSTSCWAASNRARVHRRARKAPGAGERPTEPLRWCPCFFELSAELFQPGLHRRAGGGGRLLPRAVAHLPLRRLLLVGRALED